MLLCKPTCNMAAIAVYRAAVAATVVGGRVVYRQGERAEADEIVARARERAEALLG